MDTTQASIAARGQPVLVVTRVPRKGWNPMGMLALDVRWRDPRVSAFLDPHKFGTYRELTAGVFLGIHPPGYW